MSRHRIHIYGSRLHLLWTILFVLLPVVFLILFSRWTAIQMNILFLDLALSCWRLLVAYMIAASLGWGFAALFYKGKRSAIALPLFDVLQSFPTFALLPLIVYLWGSTSVTVIFFLVITIIWPIFFSVLSSLKLARQDWHEVVTIAGMRGMTYFRNYLWPVSFPGLITGSIIGLGEGWEALVATEMIVNVHRGLGPFFVSSSKSATITALGIFGLLFIIFSLNKVFWIPLLDWSHHTIEE